jgi:hypothetical protein
LWVNRYTLFATEPPSEVRFDPKADLISNAWRIVGWTPVCEIVGHKCLVLSLGQHTIAWVYIVIAGAKDGRSQQPAAPNHAIAWSRAAIVLGWCNDVCSKDHQATDEDSRE